MSRYARVDNPTGEEFDIGVTHPDDLNAPQGQYLHPDPDEPQTVKAADLRGYEDALDGDEDDKDEDRKLKPGWYDLDEGKYLGRDRPAV